MLIYLQMIETAADKAKFVIIYEEYHNLMFYAAKKILSSDQDAEDVVHHAFEQIAKNIEKIRDPLHPKTRRYAVVITENTALNLLKRKKLEMSTMQQCNFSTASHLEIEDDLLASCILKLPQEQQHVIWLKYHLGYNLHEIARMKNITFAAATKLDQRAKTKLKQLYTEGGGTL